MRGWTLADHAECWWAGSNQIMPARGTTAWTMMYEQWAEWAFSDLRGKES